MMCSALRHQWRVLLRDDGARGITELTISLKDLFLRSFSARVISCTCNEKLPREVVLIEGCQLGTINWGNWAYETAVAQLFFQCSPQLGTHSKTSSTISCMVIQLPNGRQWRFASVRAGPAMTVTEKRAVSVLNGGLITEPI